MPHSPTNNRMPSSGSATAITRDRNIVFLPTVFIVITKLITPPGQEGWPKAGVVDERRAASLLNSDRCAEIYKDASHLLSTTPLAALAAPPVQEGRCFPYARL